MGMMSADSQEKAARYLVKVLEEKGGKVHYSEFYDGTEETGERLCAGTGIIDGAEHVMDDVAAEMEAQGFVRLIWHQGEELADGEPAYSIELTGKGCLMLKAGRLPKFRDLWL
jgi:hypothetical protein